MKTIGDTHAEFTHDNAAGASAIGNAFRLEEFLPYELEVTASRTSRLFARRYEAAFGLSVAEWRVLAVVGRFGTVTPSTVAERTDMDKVKVSRAAAALVAADLLEQGPAPHDGRARLLRLTRKGLMVHDNVMPMAMALQAQLAAGLSDQEWTMLRDCLHRLREQVRILDDTEHARRQRRQGGPRAVEV